MMALSLMPAMMTSAKRKLFGRGGVAVLVAGLLASLSRGPWMGAAISVAVLAATTRRPVSNLMRVGFLSLAAFPIVALTPFGSKIIDLLPFIGTVESSTIDYRQQLMDVGWDVVMRNPLFGSENYLKTPAMQSLEQGQGIIDIVNTYLQYALDYGLVGLSLFVCAQFFAVVALYRSLGAARAVSVELGAFCQGYLAALVSMLVVIATTSSLIAQMQEVIWMLCGMSVGLARSVAYAAATAQSQPAALAADPQMVDPAPGASAPEPKSAKPTPGRDLPPHLRQYAKRPS
jgi:O-antigen ligase